MGAIFMIQLYVSRNLVSQKLFTWIWLKAFLSDLKRFGFFDSNSFNNCLFSARAVGRLSSGNQLMGQLQSGAI